MALRFTYADGDNVGLAVGAIVFTVLALSLGDALIKRISAEFPLWQIFVLRSALAVPVVIAVMKTRHGSAPLLPANIGWTALRSMMLTVMWIAYYAALLHVDLSAAAAVYYTLPLFITLFAALFIGDKVGPAGWLAVASGFSGVVLILRPQAGDFNAYALLPLASAILYALAMIITRTKCRNESPLTLSLALNLCLMSVGGVASVLLWLWAPPGAAPESHGFLTGDWIPMGPRQWFAMGLLATAAIIGSVGAAIAYQAGPSATVSTFDFFYLAFAALWGFLFFSEVPDEVGFAGIVLIAAAGIIAVRR